MPTLMSPLQISRFTGADERFAPRKSAVRTDEETWSTHGAERSQPTATAGRRITHANRQTTCYPPLLIVSNCRGCCMVRRGSTVRVRQRALQKRRTSALSRMCSVGVEVREGLDGAVHGAFASRTPPAGRPSLASSSRSACVWGKETRFGRPGCVGDRGRVGSEFGRC
jgi:hypothetical protein